MQRENHVERKHIKRNGKRIMAPSGVVICFVRCIGYGRNFGIRQFIKDELQFYKSPSIPSVSMIGTECALNINALLAKDSENIGQQCFQCALFINNGTGSLLFKTRRHGNDLARISTINFFICLENRQSLPQKFLGYLIFRLLPSDD